MTDVFWRFIEMLNVVLLGMVVWQIVKQRREDRDWRNYWKWSHTEQPPERGEKQ